SSSVEVSICEFQNPGGTCSGRGRGLARAASSRLPVQAPRCATRDRSKRESLLQSGTLEDCSRQRMPRRDTCFAQREYQESSVGSGIGMMKRAPHERAYDSWVKISSLKFQGRMRM